MVVILREKFCFTWIEYVFGFVEMSILLCKYPNSGKFRHLIDTDSVLKIEKVKFVTIRAWRQRQSLSG